MGQSILSLTHLTGRLLGPGKASDKQFSSVQRSASIASGSVSTVLQSFGVFVVMPQTPHNGHSTTARMLCKRTILRSDGHLDTLELRGMRLQISLQASEPYNSGMPVWPLNLLPVGSVQFTGTYGGTHNVLGGQSAVSSSLPGTRNGSSTIESSYHQSLNSLVPYSTASLQSAQPMEISHGTIESMLTITPSSPAHAGESRTQST